MTALVLHPDFDSWLETTRTQVAPQAQRRASAAAIDLALQAFATPLLDRRFDEPGLSDWEINHIRRWRKSAEADT